MMSEDPLDYRIQRLNSLGFSLRTIGETLDIHHTTVRDRLKGMQIRPSNTDGGIVSRIIDLDSAQQEWLVDQIEPDQNIHDYLRSLMLREYEQQLRNNSNANSK